MLFFKKTKQNENKNRNLLADDYNISGYSIYAYNDRGESASCEIKMKLGILLPFAVFECKYTPTNFHGRLYEMSQLF